MTRGELQRHRQPTDIENYRNAIGSFSGTQLLVFAVISISALAVVALTAAVVAISIAIVAVALRPYFKR